MELRIRFFDNGRNGRKVWFSISRREIESQSGLTFVRGRPYRLEGGVRGLWEFNLERTISRDRYLDLYVPTNYQAGFKRGGFYEVRIESIQPLDNERGETRDHESQHSIIQQGRVTPQEGRVVVWSLDRDAQIIPHLLKAQLRNGKAISFALNKSWLEGQTKFIFEVGKTYRVSGSLGGICGFSSLLRETGYSEIHQVCVPQQSVALFKPGDKYDVRLEEIAEIFTNEPKVNADDFWEWKTVTAWTDTEGQYVSNKPPFKAVISQDEREPLEGIRCFLFQAGIPSVVYDMGDGHYQLRTLGGMETLARFIFHTEPFIRTRNKMSQIKQFKEWLGIRSEHEHVHKRNARRILGL